MGAFPSEGGALLNAGGAVTPEVPVVPGVNVKATGVLLMCAFVSGGATPCMSAGHPAGRCWQHGGPFFGLYRGYHH